MRFLRGLIADERGTVFILMTIGLAGFLSAAALATVATSWLMTVHALQNAADSAAIAAVTNHGTSYSTEAKAVTALYGFVDGSNGVTVTVTRVRGLTQVPTVTST